MDAEWLRLLLEIAALLASAAGLLFRLGVLRASIEGQLRALTDRLEEVRREAKEDRAETRSSLAQLKDGQASLALAQNGDHVLLGKLEGTMTALDTRANEGLKAQRAELERQGARLEAVERDMAFLRGRIEETKRG